VEENCKVDPPINLNCWKHHSAFIKKQIETINSADEFEKLKTILLKIGESQMDLYYGELFPAEICKQSIDFLKSCKIFLREKYKDWLNDGNKDYQLVQLSDESVWTFRLGENVERYIHIHPARHSANTRRVKALTLKTAILTLCYERIGKPEYSGKELINQIRKKYLNEPPLKSVTEDSGLGKLLKLLR